MNTPRPEADTAPPVVVLHIGAMKTGTTFLQGKAYANRAALADGGVELAGGSWGEQVWAVQEVLGMGARDAQVSARNAGAWQRLSEAMRESAARVSLLSMEFLAFADPSVARRVIASLDGLEVRIVITVRDTAAVMPALWQTTITSGGTTTWPAFRRAMRVSAKGGGRGGRVLALAGLRSASRFEEAVDLGRILRTWSSVVPVDRIHVVAVPRPGAPRDRLWNLFCETLDVDGTQFAAEPADSNESLGYPSAELVRRVNESLDLERMRDQNVVKNDLGLNTLGRRRKKERRALLDEATLVTALRWNVQVREEIEQSGVVVHGDLADLPGPERIGDYDVEEGDAEPTEEELLEAARFGFRGVRRLVKRRSQRILRKKRRRRLRRKLRRRLIKPPQWREQPAPVDAAVADLTRLVRALVRLKRRGELKKQRRRQAGRSD